jgi:hypothetical protein
LFETKPTSASVNSLSERRQPAAMLDSLTNTGAAG